MPTCAYGSRVLGHDSRDELDALDTACDHMPDVVAVDLMMPRMDGHAFLRAVRAIPAFASVPVVIVPAVQAELDQAIALADARRRKPFDLDDLLQRCAA